MEERLGNYLKTVSPTKETVELFNAFLRKTYYTRIADLKKRQEEADDELKKLYTLRQGLVEKNLMGIYSDEMFKEQNSIIEQKIRGIQIAKNDGLLTHYSIEKTTNFILTTLSDLKHTYTREDATLAEKRTLLGSIFDLGLVWDGKQYSNHSISDSYKQIQRYKVNQVAVGRAVRSRLIQGYLAIGIHVSHSAWKKDEYRTS